MKGKYTQSLLINSGPRNTNSNSSLYPAKKSDGESFIFTNKLLKCSIVIKFKFDGKARLNPEDEGCLWI